MLPLSTNKPTQQSYHQASSQSGLHVKILSLVANRMNPVSPTLALQKQACASCLTASPATTKRNSLAATRNRQKNPKSNQTICEGYSSLKEQEEGRPMRKRGSGSVAHLTRDFLVRHARKMALQSKVVSLSIQHTKIGDFTIDLRKQMPTEFVNVKMLSKLRVQNMEKERRIGQLQREVLELHEKIIEMSLNLERHSRESFNDMPLPASMKQISEINREKENVGSMTDNLLSQCFPKQNGDNESRYESLLRIIKLQANQIQKNQLKPKQKQKRHSFL